MIFRQTWSFFKRAVCLFFVNLFVFIALFIGAETFYRYYIKSKPPENLNLINDVSHVPKPYVMFTSKPNTQKNNYPGPEAHINTLGYLNQIPPREKTPSTYRIFVLGGSLVYNGTPPFSFLLQDIFHQHGQTNVEVYNYGVVSSVSRQELVRTLLEISTYQPDLVISFSGYNDVFNTGWDRRINFPHRYILFEKNPFLTLRAADFNLSLSLIMSSELLRKFFGSQVLLMLTDNHDQPAYNQEERQQKAIKAYLQNLRLTNLLAHNFGAKFLAYFQPTVYFKKPLTDAEEKIVSDYSNEPAASIRQNVLEQYQKFKTEFSLTDTSNLFAGERRQVFIDPVHFADQQFNQVVADFLFLQITKKVNMRLKKKSRVPGLIPEDYFILGSK